MSFFESQGTLIYGDRDDKSKQLTIDLLKEWSYHKTKQYSLKKEPLAKALGVKGNGVTQVLDATCGTGKDTVLILTFGGIVTALERNPVVAKLLSSAIEIAKQSDIHIFKNLNFINSDAKDLTDLELYNVIYLDPMYPHKKKKALPRKEMVLFRDIVGDDPDVEDLFHWAMNSTVKRVVVKRPVSSGFLVQKPSHSFTGKSTRYDVYLKT